MSKKISKAASVLGKSGGSVKNPRKGFGSMSPEELKALAKRANDIRWGRVRAEKAKIDNK